MNYKVTLFNSRFYKEIKLDGVFQKGLLIGTSKECQIRFFREQFFTDFMIRIQPNEGQWVMICEDSVYLKKNNAFKTHMEMLEPQDVVSVCYDVYDTELFQIEFAIDFQESSNDYNRAIDLSGCDTLQIGGVEHNTIYIADESLKDEYIVLQKKEDGFCINQIQMKYQIAINGCRARENEIAIKNQDFFTVHGYSFYMKDNTIYTAESTPLRTSLPVKCIRQETNHLKYPCFVRSARQRFEIPEERIEILPPKKKPDEPQRNLISTMVPLLVSMGMMVSMRMMMGTNKRFAIMCACMSLVSIVMAVINYRNEGIQYRKNLVKRENDYNRYIAEQEEKIQKLREKEELIAKQKYPSLEEHIAYVENFDARLFEKQKSHDDFMTLCIGEGTVPSKNQLGYKAQEYREVEDELSDYPEKLHDKYQYIEHMPVLIDLTEKNAIGFIGDRNHLYQMAKNLILLYATEHYYQEMKVFLLMQETDAQHFYWARWIKNMTVGGIRNFAYNDDSNKVVLEYLYSELCNREKLKQNEIKCLPVFSVLVYRSEVIGKHPVSQYINKAADLGFCFLFFEEYAEKLNQYCEKRIFLQDNQFKGYVQDIKNGELVQHFTYAHIPGVRAAQAAIKLGCVYADEVSLEASLTKNITLFQLLGIMNPYDLEIENRWANSKIYDSMAAPLGVKSGGEKVYLDIHEKYHGPHGLVAGTTGSGKSEIMQSYVLSMATLFHPYEVGFIIIDFKGGGMANQFRDLPHLNGAITNIDDGEIQRSLSSIKAELKKRQRLFAEFDVNHIDEYIKLFKSSEAKEPLPHLILIVDEFAELKSEQPDFMKELISTARIGRSLGVHLILATQKPAGVVNDQIWSNSKFKLCLKVQNKSDSNEVLKSPLAAEIREPGRAYLQVGNNEIFQLFQSAYSGAPIPNSTMEAQKAFRICKVNQYGGREIIFEQKKETSENAISQLDALVDYVKEYCEKKQIKRLPDICLPPLLENIPYQIQDYITASADICVPLGIYDAPEIQYQGVFDVDLSQGNIFIIGSSQMGKTNMLQTMIRGIATRYTSDEVHMYILDFASMILKNFEGLKHIGNVMVSTEEDKLKAFFKMMEQELNTRKEIFSKLGLSSFSSYREAGKTELPQIVIMIDNISVFRELYYSLEDKLLKLVREGSAVGISIVVTTMQSSGLGYKYLSNFGKRFALYCNDSGEYGTVIERCRMTMKQIPGRCFFSMDKMIYAGQIYQAFPAEKEIEKVEEIRAFIKEMNTQDKGNGAKRIPVMPEVVTPELILTMLRNDLKPYKVPIGINYDNLDVDVLDIRSFTLLGIGGSEQLGRVRYVSYMLQCLLSQKEAGPVQIYLVDSAKREFQKYAEQVTTYETDIQKVPDILHEINDILTHRSKLIESNEISKLTKEPLICLLINAPEAYELIGEDKDLMEMTHNMLTRYAKLKFSMVLTDVPNVNLLLQASPLLKLFNTARNLILFEQIEQQKLVVLRAEDNKKYKDKPLIAGDAYFKCGDYFGKYKTPTA